MKFEEKLISLRKQKGLSQEELAERLNVTRQTISKWELGQSKPDMDKLMEISKLFDINVDRLTNDNENLENNKVSQKPKAKGDRKYILYILICILIAAIATLGVRLGNRFEENKKKIEEDKKKQEAYVDKIFDTITGVTDSIQNQQNVLDNFDNESIQQQVQNIQQGINNEEVKEQVGNMFDIFNEQQESALNQKDLEREKEKFNFQFVHAAGTKVGLFVRNTFDDVIKSNKTNKEHLVTVKFNKKETTDVEVIKNMKKSLKDQKQYEVSVDYDKDGFINKITVENI